MATLEKLRQKGPLVAIVIGFALFAFIFTDLFSNISTVFGDDQRTVAEINGEAATIDDFQARFNTVKSIYEYLGNTVDNKLQEQIQNQVWEQIVQERLLSGQYADLGIDVSDEEAAALVTGTNIDVDPTIRPYFSNRQTGEFYGDAAIEFFKTVDQDPGKKRFGLFLEHEMITNRKFTKYNSLIAKGLNVTSVEAEDLYRERLHMVDIEYVVKKYESISDSSIQVSDAEIKEYYGKHKNEYKQKHTRDIAYVTFPIIPSEKDKSDALNSINEYLEEFTQLEADSANENIKTYIVANSDEPFDADYYASEEMPSLGLDSAFFASETGNVTGPYEFNGMYNIARIIDRRQVPDTVEARHILIQPDGQVIKDIARAKKLADSIIREIKSGKDFAELAKEHGSDGTAEKGGDLGKFTQGRMVPAFNDAVFFNETGYLGVVETQFGAHVVEITYQSPKKEKIQLALLKKQINNVDAGEKLYQETKVFAGENNTLEKFEAAVQEKALTKKIATDITPQTKVIAGLSEANSIINWVFKKTTKKGMVSQDDIIIDNQYIVVVLTDIKEDGVAPLEQVKEQITAELIKQKKGEQLAKQLADAAAGGKSFSEIASAVGGETFTEKNKSFTASRLRVGDEQAVIANAVKMQKDNVSEPIIGETGVFLIKVTSVTGVEEVTPEQIVNDRKTAQNRLMSRSRSAYNALKESADIKDNRHMFF